MNWKNWFRRGERKSTDPSLLLGSGMNSVDSLFFDSASLIRNAYIKNATVMQSILLISDAIAGLPLKIYREEHNEEVLLPDHPAWNLLRRPNLRMSWKKWVEAFVTNRYFNGNNYILIVAGLPKYPTELWLLEPNSMQIKVSQDYMTIVGYEYRSGGYHKIYVPEDIMHIASHNSNNSLYGSPILEACQEEAIQDNLTVKWNSSLLKQLGVPPVLLEAPADTEELTDAQRARIYQLWEERQAGSANAGRPLIMSGFKATVLGLSPKDMDWQKGRIMSQISIAKRAGVPPEMAGIQGEKTYANYTEARKSFYEDTIIPQAKDLLNKLAYFLSKRWDGEEFLIGIDTARIDALQEAQTAKWDRVMKAKTEGVLTINEARAELGKEPIDGGDIILVNGSMLPLDMVSGDQMQDDVMPSASSRPEPDMDLLDEPKKLTMLKGDK